MTHRILPIRFYVMVYAALLLLLGATVATRFLLLGAWNLILALTVSAAQALLAVLFFMHVRYSSRLIWISAAIGFYWLAILFTLTMSDFISRAWPPFGGG